MRTREEIERHITILYATIEAYHDFDVKNKIKIEFHKTAIASLIWVLDPQKNTNEDSPILDYYKDKYFNLYECTYRTIAEELAESRKGRK